MVVKKIYSNLPIMESFYKIRHVPEVLNVRMNVVEEEKIKLSCAEFFQTVKALNFIERKCDYFNS